MIAAQREFEQQSPTVNAGPDFCTYSQFRLELLSGPSFGAEEGALVSTGLCITIGSDPACDFTIADPDIAPFHCELLATTNSIRIRRLTSQAHMTISGLQIGEAELSGTTELRLGNSTIKFEAVSSSLHVRRSPKTSLGEIISSSESMRDLVIEIERAMRTDASVLLRGASGTGKRMIAQAIHTGRKETGSYVEVDCSGAGKEVESALMRAFDAIEGGTLHLLNVEELNEDLQYRLLRVYRRGGPNEVAGLRLISSTKADLRVMVNQGSFDSRLLSHLGERQLQVPSMSERKQDILRLCHLFLVEAGLPEDVALAMCRDQAEMERITSASWPGNGAALRSFVCASAGARRWLATSARAEVAGAEMEALPAVDIEAPIKTGREDWIKYFERLYLKEVLSSEGGNVTKAAKVAGVDRGHFYRLMMRCGLRGQ